MQIHSKVFDSDIRADHRSSSPEAHEPGLYRDTAIDFTKGALVLFMVLYHWLNYFIGPSGHYYAYLRFLTPSFIFITGFMISQIHLRRYKNNCWHLARRLIVRGIKLLAVFVLLNAAIIALLSRPSARYPRMDGYLRGLYCAFTGVNPTSPEGFKGVSFSMLVPIAYLLIVAAGLVAWTKRGRFAFGCTLILLTIIVCVLGICGSTNGYLDLLLIGILGVVIGFARRERIETVLNRPQVLIALYCCYLTVISIWSVMLPLQVVSVILTTALLYIAGNRRPGLGAAERRTVLLGRYSLLGYIAQIAILQMLRRVAWLSRHGVGALLTALVAGMLLTFIVVELVDVTRRKSKLADGVYRFVFA